MFKVISAELKKMVSKPGIYVLSILLAIILVLGVFIYKPTVHKSNSVELNYQNVLQKHSYFENNTKPQTLDEISKTINIVKYYNVETENGVISHKENINNKLKDFESKLQTYLSYAYEDSETISDSFISNYARPELIKSLKELNTAVDGSINQAKQGSYAVITTESNYETYTKYYSSTLALLSTNVTKDKIATIVHDYNTKYKAKFIGSIQSLKYPTLAESTIETFTINETGTNLHLVYTRLNRVEQKINEMVEIAKNGSKDTPNYIYNLDPKMCDKLDELATEYVAVANTYTNLIKYHLITSAFDVTKTSDQLSLLYLKTESEFNANSLLIRYNYLFEHNKTEYSYARPLTIGVTSNTSINAYDYAYFILRLFSFVIIVYAVMAACQTIAGEIKDGSMRYFAIRPVSRNDIFFGKMFAILLMSIIMIIFSALIAICVGGGVYGFKSLNILTIFNGTTGIVLHPIAMLGIYLLSFVLEIFVYLAIAMFLSSLIKSDLFAVTLMLVIYIVNTLIPMFVGGPNTWLAYYPFSHISLYSLFGSTVYGSSSNFFNLILGMKVYAGTNLGLTIFAIATFIIIFTILAINKFKKKEL